MNKKLFLANGLLLLAAAIWGFAFVAQRVGMEHLGPFMFNGVRFMLGAISLVPLILLFGRRVPFKFKHIWGGVAAGTALFLAASFQQTGLVYTTAGKAGFITGLYLIIVPFLGYLFLKHEIKIYVWAGALLALAGLYLLSITGKLHIEIGDLYVLAGALFWAVHILTIGFVAKKIDSIVLAAIQFLVCSLFSFAVGIVSEPVSFTDIADATVPLLYVGILSTGVAFTLQIIAQKTAHPAHASIIMSMESLFAVIGGWIILSEQLSTRAAMGCLLMLVGMIISQIRSTDKTRQSV